MRKTAVAACTVFGFVVLSGLSALPARAATVNVASGAAFASAVAAATSGDTVNITQDITITAEVAITKTLTVNGQGHILSVPVPGLSDSGVYNTNPSAFRALTTNVSGGVIAINDLTIKGGALTDHGAGIYNGAGTRLELTRVNISNGLCLADIGMRSGGGLYNNNGVVYLIDSNISRNAASYGGGFMNTGAGKMYVENSTISENRSTASNGGGGAGENGGTLYVNNSAIANNKSTELGGALNHNGGSLYVLNSTFTGNVAYVSGNPGAYLKGGAISINGTAATYLINSVFAYNYWNSGTADTPVYVLNDVYRYSVTSQLASAYNCVFQAPDDAAVINHASNRTYAGAASGSDDAIFSGGSTTRVLAPNGAELGTATIYQPFLRKAAGAYVPVAALQTGSYVLGQGIRTRFSDINGVEVVGYHNGTGWVYWLGAGAEDDDVTIDQNHVDRALIPAVGAVETGTGALYMLKVNSATGGTVSGGSVYGDVYPSGTDVTLTALPSDGYSFTRWDYALGGEGTASTSDSYTLTLSQNTTLVPVLTVITGYTVTYMGNGNTGGTAPATQTAEADATTVISGANTLVKSGYGFSGWNTRSDGSGTAYAAGSTYTSNSTNLVLYAQYVLPAAPTGATATATSENAITLSWTDDSSNETGFIVGFSADNETFSNLPATTNTSRSVVELDPNTRYWLRVAATNAAGNSAYAAALPKYTFATLPTAASATADGANSITVSWSGGAASTWQVTQGGIVSGWSDATSHRFTGLACGTTYSFNIKAKNGDGIETVGSSAVSGTTLACASGFVPTAKPDVSNLRFIVSGGSVNFNALPAGAVQFTVSITPDFEGASWEDVADKDAILAQYGDQSGLYVKFRNAAGGVSDTAIYQVGVSEQTPREGDIVKTPDNFDVYIIKYMGGKQYKRLILSPSVFNSYQHLKWENLKVVSQAQMDSYTISMLARVAGDPVIYELTPLGDTGRRKPLDLARAYDPDSVYEINAADRDSYVLAD